MKAESELQSDACVAASQGKNAALAEAGAIVPESFEGLEGVIKETYERLVAEGSLVPQPDTAPPSVPLDLEAAKKAGKVMLCCSVMDLLAPFRHAAGLSPHLSCHVLLGCVPQRHLVPT